MQSSKIPIQHLGSPFVNSGTVKVNNPKKMNLFLAKLVKSTSAATTEPTFVWSTVCFRVITFVSEIKYKTFTGTGPGSEGLDPAIGRAFKCDNFDGVYSVDPAEEPVTSQNNSPEFEVPEFDPNAGEVGNLLDLLFGVFGDH
ncbi:hypothetical protein MMC22_006442 [Lobaria immixta]|nr:hypothetical protein [Lobaria immixta]